MTLPLDVPSSTSLAILVEFWYENPATYVRYARWESDISYGGNSYTSLARLSVDLPQIDGTVRPSITTIDMEEVAPIDAMRTTFPPTYVRVIELDPSIPDSAYTLYEGRVSKCSYNHNGNPRLVQVEVSGPKRDLEGTVSWRIGRFCANTFGARPCGYDREATKETVTVTAIDGNRITVSGFSLLDPATWKHGGVRYRGFEIPIHFQESLSFIHLVKPAPTHWLGEDVDVLWGCDGSIESCRTRGQESVFTGIGINLPLRDIRITE